MQNIYDCKNRRKYNLKANIVLVTKYRKRLLVNGMGGFLKRSCAYLAEQNDWNIIDMETDKDHIHIILEYDATECICGVISTLK